MTRTPGRPRAASASRIGASEAFTLTPGPRKTGTDSFRSHRPLELGKNANHLKQRLAGDVVVSRPCWRRNRSILSGAIRRESRPNPAGMWLAGNLRNWPLAEYELSQMNATLQDARALFPNVPAADTSES